MSFLLCSLFVAPISYSQSSSAEFVGAKACQSCHQKEVSEWRGSHHDMSMKHADKTSVLGNFDDVKFISNKETNRFYKKGSQYWVNIKGPDGKFHDYQIKYTFGYQPLQQYMVEFDDGRVQLIPFAWDSRSKAKGGDRWFNLYPDMTAPYQEFFWTNTGQNWNYMCADCHSTNVMKNFDLKNNSYKTSFSEINVACESCHGPASEHISWTKTQLPNTNLGFNRNLTPAVSQWIHKNERPNTLSPQEIKSSQQVLVCAQCHSRRTQISDNDHVSNNAFGERYMLDLISTTNYHPDGQVNNEDFVYGSFLQSKMHQNGVVCSDCHNPHSAKLKLPIKSLCLQCHQASNYAVEQHHKHPNNSTGAQCVNCHMPETTYMEIDDRRDHGFHIPRPDLAKQLGTPDTCLSCHEDKNSQWSAEHVNTWFPDSTVKAEKDFAPVFSASNLSLNEQQLQDVANELSRIAQTSSYAPIIRASALSKMANVANTNTTISIARAVKNANENIRLGAIEGAENLSAPHKWRILKPLLSDKVLMVRINAAFTLAALWGNLTPEQQGKLTPALNEYIESQNFNSDRSFAHANLAILHVYQGQYEQAITTFNQGIEIEPYFTPSYLNLSRVYRQLGETKKEIATLMRGINANPADAELPYNLGLTYIRAKDKPKASQFLGKATELAPQNSHYFYVYGLSLELESPKLAYRALFQAYNISSNPQHLYALCDMQLRHQSAKGKNCLSKLSKIVPSNVIEQLKAQYP